MTRAIVTVAAVLALPLVGAAATTPQAAYEQKVQALYAGIQSAFQATRGASGPALAERISAAQKALRHAADELTKASVPADIRAENRDLAGGMRAYARDLDRAVRAASRGDEEAMAEFEDASTRGGVRQMAEAAEEMKERGYKLGPIAKD